MLEANLGLWKGAYYAPPAEVDHPIRRDRMAEVTPKQMTIGELLQRSREASIDQFSPFGSEFVVNVTAHALSRRGTVEERLDCYNQLKGFLTNPALEATHAEAFHVAGKSFRSRPPLRLEIDAPVARPFDNGPYHGKIFQANPDVTLYVVLENEHGPIASMGLNDYGDGVEVNYIQGVKGRKSGEDLNRMGNWRERLFKLSEDYAAYRGYEYAMITPGKERLWLHPDGFTVQRATSIYDEYASTHGYAYNKSFKRFIKPIPTSARK